MRQGGRRSSHTALASACVVGAGVLLASAFAGAACPLDLVPAEASPAWKSAARSATSRLASSASRDCSSVEIAVRPSGGALLTFITTDGRRAVRALLSPEEVAPALEALLVTLPPEPARPDAAPVGPESRSPPRPAAAPSASSSPSATRAPPAASAPAAASSSATILPAGSADATSQARPSPDAHFILGASAGVRFGFGGAYASPSIALRPSGTFGPWELAATVEYDRSYRYLPGGLPADFRLWSFIAGVQVGRRDPLGPVAIAYGLGLGVASLREEANDTGVNGSVVDFGQPRATAYGRLVFPRRALVRATLDLDFDAALANFKKADTVRNDLPELPRWGLLVSAGVETSAL